MADERENSMNLGTGPAGGKDSGKETGNRLERLMGRKSGLRENHIKKVKRPSYVILAESVVTGILVGLVISMLRISIKSGEALRGSLIAKAAGKPGVSLALIALLAGLYALMCLIVKLEPMAGSSGIPQVKAELLGKMRQRWYTVLPAKFALTVIDIGSGLSLGREGPSVQLGSMTAKGVAKFFRAGSTEVKMMISCGAGAGIACAFGAPLSGVLFVLEAMHGYFSSQILINSMAACFAGVYVTSNIFGLKPVFDLKVTETLPTGYYWILILLGLIMGLFGVAFYKGMLLSQDLFSKMGNKYARMAVPFACVVPVAAIAPDVLGSGEKLMEMSGDAKLAVAIIAGALALKFVLVMISAGSGAPGGTLQPLLVLGALGGALFFRLLGPAAGLGPEYTENFVVYAMTAYFSAIVKAPITGVLLITEMTGNFTNFLSLVTVSLIAYIVTDLFKCGPIFDTLTECMLNDSDGMGETEKTRNERVIVSTDVYIGSMADGCKVMDISFPEGCLMISVQRGSSEIVPSGRTRIKGGDTISVLCREADAGRVEEKLALECRHIVIPQRGAGREETES